MIKMRPYVPSQRLVIRDSIVDDLSDDIDDDVFINDARSSKLHEDTNQTRPLMASRRRANARHYKSTLLRKFHNCCLSYCEPNCSVLAILTIIIATIILIVLFFILPSVSIEKLQVFWTKHTLSSSSMDFSLLYNDKLQNSGSHFDTKFIPCNQIRVQKLWIKIFPRISSESPVRKADLNNDNVNDIIFGYKVDDSIQFEDYTLPKCKSPLLGDEVPCEGGVIAVNGLNGDTLWQSWCVANVFSLSCSLDINQDNYTDCIAAGKLGMILAINGRNGNNIWVFRDIEVETNSPIIMDLFTINIVHDLDGDEIPEILALHLEEREESRLGHIKIISGRTGQVIRSIPTPYHEEVFIPVQIIMREDGTEDLLITTGGHNTPGGLYIIRLLSLMQFTNEEEFIKIYHDKHSGLMVPSVLSDITGDGIADIIVASFNSTIMAFDGSNFNMLWNYSVLFSNIFSAIVPGHFNHDNITDFMIKYNIGPGYPIYYYSQTTILDGRNGKPLLSSMLIDSGGANNLLGGLSISQTFGSDFFLHWQMLCSDKMNYKDAYEFISDSDVISQVRADTCRLRYNTSTVIKLYAIAQSLEPPGAVLFSTDDLEIHLNRTQVQLKNTSISLKSKLPSKHSKSKHHGNYDNINLYYPYYNIYTSNKGFKKDLSKDYETELPISLPDYENNYQNINLAEVSQLNQQSVHLRTQKKDKRHRREEKQTESNLISNEKINDTEWFMSSISSTGVLLKSLLDANLSIDFAFILNIRESGTYPPLYSPEDHTCVQQKINAYKGYMLDNKDILLGQFLKQCLQKRLTNIEPELSKYESQLILIRIAITCSCNKLESDKYCSQIENIHNQKWTEYMGDNANGYY